MGTQIPELHHDLLNGSTVALSTHNADGSIQTTAVWVLLDNEALKMSLATDRQKYRNLVRDPRATVFALDPQNRYRYLEVRATVSIVPDDDDRTFARKVFAAYGSDIEAMPELLAEERAIVTFAPERVHAH
jgi:PPOX class probable F420-dependent enzyme